MHARNLPVAAARLVTAFAVAIALSVGFATAAFAVSDDYPSASGATTFATTDEGWTGTSPTGGLLCIPPLTCPDADTDYDSSGGTGGQNDGYLRSDFAGLASVGAISRTEWTSPAFTYNGAGGATPDEIFYTMDRRDDRRRAALLDQ